MSILVVQSSDYKLAPEPVSELNPSSPATKRQVTKATATRARREPMGRRTRAMTRVRTWRFQSSNSAHRRVALLVPGFVAFAATAFTEFSPVNPGVTAFLLWTPAEVGLWAFLLGAGFIWSARMDLKAARRGLSEVRRAEELRRAISAIGVAASWDLDLNRLYRRISQDLRSIIEFDRFTVTSALPTGRMRIEFVNGNAHEGLETGSLLPLSPSEPDGLLEEYRAQYKSRLTAAIPACSGTLTIRSREADRYTADHLDLLRQAIAQISPGIANATVFRASERQVRERTVLAEIGRAVTSEQEPHAIFESVDSSLSRLISYDHLGVVLVDDGDAFYRAGGAGSIVYWSRDGLAERSRGDRIRLDPCVFSLTDVIQRTGFDPLGIGASGKVDDRGSRVWLQAPLVVQERLIGLLMLSSDDAGAFGPEQAALAQNVSLQIAPAIRNAQMLAAERELRETLDRQNQQLYEANNARKQFLSTVSHELKTPLTIISGFIDLLASKDGVSSEEDRRETLRIIRKNADQLDVLINDILDISRLDAGTFKINPAPFSVNKLIADLHASFQSVLKLRSQTLTVQSNEDDTWIDADRARISQVITNILSNACKYSPEKTEINLICEIDGDRLHLAIVDHGIGMTGEEQQSLFTAFFRADNETTRTVPGTGLGLVIAKSITELHGGEVRLKSRPGVGTTIELWLPGLTAKVTAEELPQAAFTGSRLWPERDLSELDLGAD